MNRTEDVVQVLKEELKSATEILMRRFGRLNYDTSLLVINREIKIQEKIVESLKPYVENAETANPSEFEECRRIFEAEKTELLYEQSIKTILTTAKAIQSALSALEVLQLSD